MKPLDSRIVARHRRVSAGAVPVRRPRIAGLRRAVSSVELTESGRIANDFAVEMTEVQALRQEIITRVTLASTLIALELTALAAGPG